MASDSLNRRAFILGAAASCAWTVCAKALGLTLPPEILVRATEVIQ